MRQILTPFAENLADPRCAEVAAFLERRARAEGEEPAPARAEDPAPALARLAAAGRLSYELEGEAVAVFYTPSPEACRALDAGTAGGWPAPIGDKQKAALRRSRGAIFRFPAESGGGELEVFITDWSPCPAAGAVAVHRDHPFAVGLEKPEGSSFIGRFVRHPLTGDLLPVWIADWVQPEFGTGAVLVNPAHDATDLAFAREVGLPLRFGLAPEGWEGDPTAGLEPPVVKSGVAVKSGVCDGTPAAEAMERYFEILSERGLAERVEDVQAGRRLLARLTPSDGGELRWHPLRRRLAAGGEVAAGAVAMKTEAEALLTAALALDPEAEFSLVAPAAELTEGLLFLRLLVHDLHGSELEPAEVLVVQRADGTEGEEPAIARLAVLIGAPASQVVVVKQKITDQVRRFLKVHGELVDAWEGGEISADDVPKSLRKAKRAIREGDPAKVWNGLYQLQKQLRGGGAKVASLAGYFAVAGILAGVEGPADLDLQQVWETL